MKIGIIGIGNMGMPLLKNFLKKNFKINTLLKNEHYSYFSNKLDNISPNIIKYNNINYFLNNSDFIFSVLPKSDITLDIVNNINDIDIEQKKYWIDLCSSFPNDVKNVSYILNKYNIDYIDAPVSGGPSGMKNSTLSTIISGSEECYTNAFDYIKMYSKNIYYISGNVGTASHIKLANNTLLASNLISVAEVMNILENEDIDIKKAIDFINNSSGRSWVTLQRYPDNILNNKFDYGFSYDLHKKDVLTFLNTFDQKKLNNTYILKNLYDIYNNESNIIENMDHTEIVKIINKYMNK